MKSTNRKRALLVSASVILLCMTIIVGMTWALFTDAEILNHHLQAGDLDITLTRTNLVTRSLNRDTGLLVDTESSADVVFTNTSKNVFDIDGSALIVPGSKYTAEMLIENKSDVAFRYWVEVDFKSGSGVLAEQLKATISVTGGESKEAWVLNDCNLGSEQNPIAVLAKGGAQLFTVSVEFVDDRLENTDFLNNDAKKDQAMFDIIIHAVQEHPATTATTATAAATANS